MAGVVRIVDREIPVRDVLTMEGVGGELLVAAALQSTSARSLRGAGACPGRDRDLTAFSPTACGAASLKSVFASLWAPLLPMCSRMIVVEGMKPTFLG